MPHKMASFTCCDADDLSRITCAFWAWSRANSSGDEKNGTRRVVVKKSLMLPLLHCSKASAFPWSIKWSIKNWFSVTPQSKLCLKLSLNSLKFSLNSVQKFYKFLKTVRNLSLNLKTNAQGQ
jgi:hypothetical protein